MSFDEINKALTKAIKQSDCKNARILAARLRGVTKTSEQRDLLMAAQHDVRSCTVGLSGPKKRQKRGAESDRLFIGVFPTGISYADKRRERGGDYMTIARLPFETLELEWAPGKHPLELRQQVERNARAMQKRRGQEFQVSAAGQTVILGRRHQNLSGSRLSAQQEWIRAFEEDVKRFPDAYKAHIRNNPAAEALKIIDGLDDRDIRRMTRAQRAETRKLSQHK